MPTVETPQSVCRFGIARCDITPPIGIYHRMWGAASHDVATGVHRPLSAYAMAFAPADGGPGQVIVVLDHCILWAREHAALEAALREGTGLAPGELIVTYTHTHSAGLMGLERVQMPGGGLIPPYLDDLGHRLTAVVTEAKKAAGPATIAYAIGRCTMAAHRDFWDASTGEWICGFNPTGAADDTVVVARMTDPSGRTIATLVNYACHPTTLGWQNTLISPDYPGAMRDVIEQATGAPCAFLQAPSGDLGPRDGFVGDVAVADRNGRQLGYAALSALESLPPPDTRFRYAGPMVSGTKLGRWEHVPLSPEELSEKRRWALRHLTIGLAYREGIIPAERARVEQARWRAEEEEARRAGDDDRAQVCRAMAEQLGRWIVRTAALPAGDSYPFEVTALRLGDAFWVAVESEPDFSFQKSLREAFPTHPVVAISLAGGCRPSYLPARETYGTGRYQESIALLEAGALERMTAAVRAELEALSGPSARP